MSAGAHDTGVTSAVLLVVGAGTVSRAAIIRAAELARGGPVTVIGVRTRPPGDAEQVRRAVALAMTALENTGVMAHGHIAVTGSPARAVARIARARGARLVVLDKRGAAEAVAFGAELRRRMYGSGIVVLSATEPSA